MNPMRNAVQQNLLSQLAVRNAVQQNLLSQLAVGQRIHYSTIKEFEGKHSFKKTDILSDEESDPTKYRISFLEDNEEKMWQCTVGNQWNLSKRKDAAIHLAREQKLYPFVKPKAIKHFNVASENKNATDFLKNARCQSDGRHLLNQLKFMEPDSGIQSFNASRGRTQKNTIGKSFGPPIGKDGFVDNSFDSRVIMIEKRSQFFNSGKKNGFKTIVVVGNRNGLMGMGTSFGETLFNDSLTKSRDQAYQQLHYFERYQGYTVPYPLAGSYHRTEMHVMPTINLGANIANFYVKYMLDLAGYRGVTVKMSGRNTREMQCKALINTLLSYETHQEQADRLGRHVVRFHRGNNYKPQVLASPKPGSIPVPITGEVPHHRRSSLSQRVQQKRDPQNTPIF